MWVMRREALIEKRKSGGVTSAQCASIDAAGIR